MDLITRTQWVGCFQHWPGSGRLLKKKSDSWRVWVGKKCWNMYSIGVHIFSQVFLGMSSISGIRGITIYFGFTRKCQGYSKYQVIPDISGYPIPHDFQNRIGSGINKCRVAGGYRVSDGPCSWTLLKCLLVKVIKIANCWTRGCNFSTLSKDSGSWW